VFYLDVVYVSHIWLSVYVPNDLLLDVSCIQVFHISEVCSDSHGAPGPADGGVLVLIPAPEPRLRGERGVVSLGRRLGTATRPGAREERCEMDEASYVGVPTRVSIQTPGARAAKKKDTRDKPKIQVCATHRNT
jgi:hypothetical protein